MNWMSQKYFELICVLIILAGATYSHDNDTSLASRRRGKVSGRIVKLYSGPKPDPILCVKEGFQADAVDCSVFYRCLKATNGKYAVYRFQCGPGTIYDPETEICNHPRSTKRSECGGLNSNKLLTSTQKNNENEIDGFNQENEELPSPINNKLPKVNASISNSLPPKSETSGSFFTTNIYPSATISNSLKGETTSSSTSTVSPWGTSPTIKPWNYTPSPATYYVTRQPDVSSVKCTSDGFIGDNEDCRKFYRCVNNQRGGFLRYEFSCSESTIWDDDTQGCNHPWAVQRRRCGKGHSYDKNYVNYFDQIKNNEVAANYQDQPQVPYGSKITQPQTQASTESTYVNKGHTYFGDRITQEKNVVAQSQANLGYGGDSESHSQINYENKVTPKNPQIDRYTNSSKTHNHNHQSNNPMSTTVVTPTQAIKDTNKCTKIGFIGNSVDCKNFLRCISNEKGGFTVLQFSCSDGTLWDEELETCNFAWAVKKCGENKSNRSTKLPISIIENTTFKDIYATMSSSFYNNDIDENSYTSQSNHDEDKPKSSTKTTLPTPTTESSKFSELFNTDCTTSGFFGNNHDCAKFYRCVEEGKGKFTKYEYKCGDGTLWDSDIQSCNHARSVKSCNSNNIISTTTEFLSNADNAILTTVTLIQTTTQKNLNNDYDSGYSILHKDPPLQSTATTENIVIQGNECKTSGFMSDNNDCNKFYRCVENGRGGYTRHEFKCGEGTVWDPNIEACNHAWAVKKCGGGPIKDNNINEITSASSVSEDTSGEHGSNIINQDNDKGTESIVTSTTLSSSNSVTSASSNECQSDGFMGNNNDCKIFYRCVPNGNGGFIRYEFSCGDGTVWDPNISACNHAWAVEKCGGSISTSSSNIAVSTTSSEISTQLTTLGSSSTIVSSTVPVTSKCVSNGFFGDKENCKKFYRCVEDGRGSYTRHEFSCGEGTLWDPKIEACNHEWAVTSCASNLSPDFDNLSTSPPTMKDEEIVNNTATQNNQDVTSSTENVPWSSTAKWSTPIQDARDCNTDGFVGDTQDCKKFYRCVNDGKGNFIRYEFVCGDGTVWDSEISACNHVESVKKPCSTVSTDANKENEPNYTASSSSEHNDLSTTSKGPSEIEECEQDGFFGDKNDCKKFYRCTDNGKGGFHKYDFTCGEGTMWDQEILACNHASSTSRCTSNGTEAQTENYHPQSTLPSSISQSTENTEITSSTNECTTEGFYVNTNDCTKFYRCVGDNKGGYSKYEFRCGEGTVWIQDIQACDHDSNPSLCSSEKYSTTTIAPSSQDKPLATSTTSSSSTKYTSSSIASTNPTMQDEMVSGSSTVASSSTTPGSSSAEDQDICEEPGYFGNSKDCKIFYRCVDNGKGGFTKYDFTCGDGTIWDQDIIACNHPQDVANPSCENEESSSSTSTEKTTTTVTTMSTTTQSINEVTEPTKVTSSTQSSTENSNQAIPSNKPSSNNYTCTEAGFYADPYDCKKFYRCVDWGNDGKTFSIYHFDCGDGTIWDPNLQTCNHEDSVYPPRDCSGNQSQQENNNNTTTTKQDETSESTTESSTTTIQSTTQKTSTTTESTSTTEQTSTQQSSTTEQSSTQQSTTQQNTTQQSTTQQSTTEKSTTQQSTTASESTTTQQTSTTQQSSTSEQTPTTTTDQTTTSNGDTTTTTPQTTTTESITSTTDQTTKSEQSTTQESNTEQSTENQSTTEQSTTQETTNGSSTTETGQETTTEQESSDKECPQTDDDQYMFVCPTGFRRHPKYCNLFYQCTEDDDTHEMKVAVFNCPNNTIYDESKTQCVEEEKADKKCDGQIAQKRRVKRLDANYKEPITVGKQKYSCPTVGHFPFEKNEECSPVLFKCEVSKSGKLRGLLYQCPEGYVYWSISRRCEPVNNMSGCKRSFSNWHGRYEIPIENSNVARKLEK